MLKIIGVPQNRERVYTISIRKDIDNGEFEFPESQELQLRLKDLLENDVDEKYYLSDKLLDYFYRNEKKQKENGNNFKFGLSDGNVVAKTITTKAGSRMGDNYIDVERLGGVFDTEKSKHQAGSVYNKEGLAPTLDTMQGGYRQPLIEENITEKYIQKDQKKFIDEEDTMKGGAYTRTFGSRGKMQKDICDTLTAAMGTGGGNVPLIETEGYVKKKYEEFVKDNGYIPEQFNPYNKKEIKDIAPTQTANCGSSTSSATVLLNTKSKIRKLTPKECFRLMTFSDEDFEKAKSVPTSDSQLYKQARKFYCSKSIGKDF